MIAEYRVVCERFFSRELGAYPSFGIRAVAADGHWAYIPDISPQEQKVRLLSQQMNRCELSLCHFMDVVLDSMA